MNNAYYGYAFADLLVTSKLLDANLKKNSHLLKNALFKTATIYTFRIIVVSEAVKYI